MTKLSQLMVACVDDLQASSAILSLGGIVALFTNVVYGVELFGPDWSFANSLSWQTILYTITVVAALHIVSWACFPKFVILMRIDGQSWFGAHCIIRLLYMYL